MPYFVYILYSEKLTRYYVGQTSDVAARVVRHNSGYEKFTSNGMPWVLLWSAGKETRSEAMILEKKLKNLSVKRLQQFMNKYSAGLTSKGEEVVGSSH